MIYTYIAKSVSLHNNIDIFYFDNNWQNIKFFAKSYKRFLLGYKSWKPSSSCSEKTDILNNFIVNNRYKWYNNINLSYKTNMYTLKGDSCKAKN